MRTKSKVCSKCKTEYPATEEFFHKGGVAESGLRANCKKCQGEAVSRYYGARREESRVWRKTQIVKLKKEVLDAYGNGAPCCSCCGEAEIAFLSLDHVNNDGNEHRKELGSGSLAIYRWARKNDYPPALQILCRNCNWAKHTLGKCPHQKE